MACNLLCPFGCPGKLAYIQACLGSDGMVGILVDSDFSYMVGIQACLDGLYRLGYSQGGLGCPYKLAYIQCC